MSRCGKSSWCVLIDYLGKSLVSSCFTNLRCGAPEGMDGKGESTTTNVVALQDWEKHFKIM